MVHGPRTSKMPLTSIQSEVMSVLKGNRTESSHFGGGIVLNAPSGSARYSHDFDLFHDAVADLIIHSEKDVASLEAAGFQIEKVEKYGTWKDGDTFRKAVVSRVGERFDLDWVYDSAHRFFPIVEDAQMGWRLHLFDMAVNKALTLSARSETRDYIDIVELGRRYPLASIVWAACGKDPGFSPLFLLKMMLRFARIDPATVAEVKARDLDPIELKKAWLEMADEADAQIEKVADALPDLPIGVAWVDEKGNPGWIGGQPDLKAHACTLRGCWPSISTAN